MITPQQLAQLYREHGRALELLCRSRCSSPEDCVQDAFVKLAQQAQVPNDPVAWLARVARNQAIDRSRANQRQKKHEEQIAYQRPSWFAPDREPEINGLLPDLQVALEQLDESVRDVVIAHLWGKLTFRQIAEAFEISKSTANRYFQDGLDELRKMLTCDSANRNLDNTFNEHRHE